MNITTSSNGPTRITQATGGLALALLCVLLGGTNGARAQTTRYVDENTTGPRHDGTSRCDAHLYLQDALAVAIADDEIRVANGTYLPDQGRGVTPGDRGWSFQLISGVKMYGGYAGCGASDPDERDVAANDAILSWDIGAPGDNSDNSRHVVFAHSSVDATARLDGLTITAGNAGTSGGIPRKTAPRGVI